MKNKKLQNGIEIVNLERSLASVRLRAPLNAAEIACDPQLLEKLKKLQTGVASQWSFIETPRQSDNFNFQDVADVLPRDGDYVTVRFRAISKSMVPGHWLDFTKDNVLEESVDLLQGATVYPNHDFADINNWLGSVSQVAWDGEGKASEGTPGINAEYKIDALMNPRIARGLLMKPPAIHSTSMTVLFEFDYSHPDLALESRWKFFDLLGEEVDGEIVRLIVTRIVEYWEASLVFQGADRLAKKYDEEEDDETDFAGMSANPAAEETTPPNSNEEKTMKLTKEQKTELGIEFDGDDVPETELLKAGESLAAKLKKFDGVNIAELADLQTRAKAGDTLVEEKRTEVTRLAKLAELGADEGDLDPAVADSIKEAGVDRLQQLGTYYGKKAAEKFPKEGRSSQEDSAEVDAASGAKKTTAPKKVGLH